MAISAASLTCHGSNIAIKIKLLCCSAQTTHENAKHCMTLSAIKTTSLRGVQWDGRGSATHRGTVRGRRGWWAWLDGCVWLVRFLLFFIYVFSYSYYVVATHFFFAATAIYCIFHLPCERHTNTNTRTHTHTLATRCTLQWKFAVKLASLLKQTKFAWRRSLFHFI